MRGSRGREGEAGRREEERKGEDSDGERGYSLTLLESRGGRWKMGEKSWRKRGCRDLSTFSVFDIEGCAVARQLPLRLPLIGGPTAH